MKQNENITPNNGEEKEKKKKKLIILLIIIILALTCALGFTAYRLLNDDTPSKTAVIEEDKTAELNDVDTTGQLRVKINPVITVKNDTMQNLNFCNYNEGRLLQCKIKVGEDYVYTSKNLEPREILKGDFVKMDKLKKGSNEGLAEIYSYNLDGEQIGQTNVKITLNVE